MLADFSCRESVSNSLEGGEPLRHGERARATFRARRDTRRASRMTPQANRPGEPTATAKRSWVIRARVGSQRDEPGEWGALAAGVSSYLAASLPRENGDLIDRMWLAIQAETRVPLHPEVMLWVDRSR